MELREMNERVLNHFGIDMQLRQLEEECAELLLAAKRVGSRRMSLVVYDFIEEIADVENMLMQVKIEIERDIRASGNDTFSIDRRIEQIRIEKMQKVIERELIG